MKKKLKISFVLMAEMLLICIFCIAAVKLYRYYSESHSQQELYNELKEIKNLSDSILTTGDVNAAVNNGSDMSENLSDINKDYVFWLRIDNTVIDYPVVKRDNSYYLQHDFKGNKSSHGAIFLDENCRTDDRFMIIYGHHMKDGSMFGSLKKYKESAYISNHKDVYIETDNENKHYLVGAVAIVDMDKEQYFEFNNLPQSPEEETVYFERLKKCSLWYDDNINEEKSDYIILSTCDYGSKEQRLIIVCKKVDR